MAQNLQGEPGKGVLGGIWRGFWPALPTLPALPVLQGVLGGIWGAFWPALAALAALPALPDLPALPALPVLPIEPIPSIPPILPSLRRSLVKVGETDLGVCLIILASTSRPAGAVGRTAINKRSNKGVALSPLPALPAQTKLSGARLHSLPISPTIRIFFFFPSNPQDLQASKPLRASAGCTKRKQFKVFRSFVLVSLNPPN